MLPKGLNNYTKFATTFLNMGLTPPPPPPPPPPSLLNNVQKNCDCAFGLARLPFSFFFSSFLPSLSFSFPCFINAHKRTISPDMQVTWMKTFDGWCFHLSEWVSQWVIHSFRFGDSYRISQLCELVCKQIGWWFNFPKSLKIQGEETWMKGHGLMLDWQPTMLHGVGTITNLQ